MQYSITPGDGLRAGQIVAKKLSTSPAPIANSWRLIRFLLGGVFLGCGLAIFYSDITHKAWLGVAALIAGCALGIAAFRRKRKSAWIYDAAHGLRFRK